MDSGSSLNWRFLISVLISIVSLILSYWVAPRQGEYAATKYNLRERQRKDHAIMLIETQFETI